MSAEQTKETTILGKKRANKTGPPPPPPKKPKVATAPDNTSDNAANNESSNSNLTLITQYQGINTNTSTNLEKSFPIGQRNLTENKKHNIEKKFNKVKTLPPPPPPPKKIKLEDTNNNNNSNNANQNQRLTVNESDDNIPKSIPKLLIIPPKKSAINSDNTSDNNINNNAPKGNLNLQPSDSERALALNKLRELNPEILNWMLSTAKTYKQSTLVKNLISVAKSNLCLDLLATNVKWLIDGNTKNPQQINAIYQMVDGGRKNLSAAVNNKKYNHYNKLLSSYNKEYHQHIDQSYTNFHNGKHFDNNFHFQQRQKALVEQNYNTDNNRTVNNNKSTPTQSVFQSSSKAVFFNPPKYQNNDYGIPVSTPFKKIEINSDNTSDNNTPNENLALVEPSEQASMAMKKLDDIPIEVWGWIQSKTTTAKPCRLLDNLMKAKLRSETLLLVNQAWLNDTNTPDSEKIKRAYAVVCKGTKNLQAAEKDLFNQSMKIIENYIEKYLNFIDTKYINFDTGEYYNKNNNLDLQSSQQLAVQIPLSILYRMQQLTITTNQPKLLTVIQNLIDVAKDPTKKLLGINKEWFKQNPDQQMIVDHYNNIIKNREKMDRGDEGAKLSHTTSRKNISSYKIKFMCFIDLYYIDFLADTYELHDDRNSRLQKERGPSIENNNNNTNDNTTVNNNNNNDWTPPQSGIQSKTASFFNQQKDNKQINNYYGPVPIVASTSTATIRRERF